MKYLLGLLPIITLWLSFYLVHALNLNLVHKWYGFPFIVTSFMLVLISTIIAMTQIEKKTK